MLKLTKEEAEILVSQNVIPSLFVTDASSVTLMIMISDKGVRYQQEFVLQIAKRCFTRRFENVY